MPSRTTNGPTPCYEKQPHTISLLPTYFTVDVFETSHSTTPIWEKNMNLSIQRTGFRSSSVPFRCSKHHWSFWALLNFVMWFLHSSSSLCSGAVPKYSSWWASVHNALMKTFIPAAAWNSLMDDAHCLFPVFTDFTLQCSGIPPDHFLGTPCT